VVTGQPHLVLHLPSLSIHHYHDLACSPIILLFSPHLTRFTLNHLIIMIGMCWLLILVLPLLFPPSLSLTLLGDVTLETYYGFPLLAELYTQSQPNLTISLPLGAGADNINAVLDQLHDFSIIPGPLTPAQAAANPTATVLPILSTAIVPVYRLDALNSTTTLTLSGNTLALIYAGSITNWNHSRIQHDNPGVTFPNQSITVAYQNDSRFFTLEFTTALNKFNPSISSVLPPSKLPSWPTHLYANSRAGLGLTGVVALTLDYDGTIGVCTQQIAEVAGAQVGNMINRAGQKVTPSSTSVTYTVFELQTQPTTLPTAFPDLTDCHSPSCWPIVITSWLLIDKSASPRGCDVRTAMVQFWLWIYSTSSSSSAAQILSQYQLVPTPPLVLNDLNVITTLNSITCNNQPVQTVTPTTSFPLIAPSRVQYALDPITEFVDLPFTYSPSNNPIASMMEGWTTNALTLFHASELQYDLFIAILTGAVDYVDHFLVPTFLTSIVFIYNPQISPSVTLNSSVELFINWEIIAAIIAANLSSWHDSRLVALNPVLTQLLPPNEDASFNMVFGCGATGQYHAHITLLHTSNTHTSTHGSNSFPCALCCVVVLLYRSHSAVLVDLCWPSDVRCPVRPIDHERVERSDRQPVVGGLVPDVLNRLVEPTVRVE
jgi:phosphate transport system substrate-binding protein